MPGIVTNEIQIRKTNLYRVQNLENTKYDKQSLPELNCIPYTEGFEFDNLNQT